MRYLTKNSVLIALASGLLTLAACTPTEQASYPNTSTKQAFKPSTSSIKLESQVGHASVQRLHESPAFSASSINTPYTMSRGTISPQLTLRTDSRMAPKPNSEKYAHYEANQTFQSAAQRVSTFSIDVDTGAYSNMRRMLQHGTLPPADAIRIEELINYFDYNYSRDVTAEKPFSVHTEIARTPWNKNTHLMRIALAGDAPNKGRNMPANLVFLLDVSGSMNSANKLGLVKSSISMMTEEMDANDTISIVVYAGSSGTVLEPTPANQQASIHRALGRLSAGGSTNGQQGIELAYQLALENYIEDGINRVILATDGDFNVGTTNINALKKLIADKRDSGIALTTLGFGSGNYNDHLMEQLAQEGNGNYAYIDTLSEARKVLVDELDASLINIAKDVKIQVEFNPATVSEYRLIGYTNRLLADEDFDNDQVDAGEIGSGHTVTAFYEIALVGQGGEKHTATRYQTPMTTVATHNAGELAEVRLRYKLPNQETSRLMSEIILADKIESKFANTSTDFQFAASVAAFGQRLQDSSAIESFDYKAIRRLARRATGADSFGYRAEFLRLIDIAKSLDTINRAALTPQSASQERG